MHRLRRLLLLAGAALAVGAGVAAYPWIATFLLLALTWFLRSASLAASAAGDRRRLRGAKWYDPVISLVGAPWHVVRAIPGTVLLALWSLGLALAAALICYAAAVDVDVALLVTGLTLAVSLWAGPGGSRVRSPLLRIVNPVSADLVRWSVAFAVVLAAAAVLAFLVTAEGVNWAPGERTRRSRRRLGPESRPVPDREIVIPRSDQSWHDGSRAAPEHHHFLARRRPTDRAADAPTFRPAGGFFVARSARERHRWTCMAPSTSTTPPCATVRSRRG